MMKLRYIILALLLLAVPVISVNAQQPEYFLHTVTKGQGLYSISRMYGVTEDEIIKLNPGSETVIKVGQELRIPNKQQSSSGKFHTIQKGETLYRLSVENRVSVKEICDANPGLSADNFKIGQVITIPAPSDEDPLTSTIEAAGDNLPVETAQVLETINRITNDTATYKTLHKVARKETVYRISRDYGITQEELLSANPQLKKGKLRKGDIIKIPFSAQEIAERNRKLTEAQSKMESIADSTLFRLNESNEPEDIFDDGVLRAALILPFAFEDSATDERAKMVEFYRGTLLALERLKDENISVDLKVIDSKAEGNSLQPILQNGQLDNIDIIFGPRWTSQITETAKWSTQHKVPLVLPFNSNADEVFDNPYVYQLNTPQSYFHQEIYDHFVKQFPNPNVILLDADEYKRNDFIEGLKNVMIDRNIPYTVAPVDTAVQTVMDLLVPDKQNIFIINSDESGPLVTMLPVLQIINRMKDPQIETHLFGYPKYQIYASDHLEEMYEVDTWFYSWFYTNNMLMDAVDFGSAYRRAFSRQMLVSYPSYASYGYDMSYYFLKGLSIYGRDFENHLNQLKTNPIQMGFKFERVNNWGGFINRKVFFVHFSNDYKVEKIDFDR